MAVITLDNKASIAYKNLLNKSMTYDSKGLGNEAEGIFFNIRGGDVFVDDISEVSSSAVTSGIVEYVIADLVVDPTSASHAYFAVYPTGHPLVGQRVRNAISPANGTDYEAKPYAGATAISVGDDRVWVYQYNSGVFFQQDSAFATPTTIRIYTYVGKTLSDLDYSNVNFAFPTWTGMTQYILDGNGYDGMIATCTESGYDGKVYVSSGTTWVSGGSSVSIDNNTIVNSGLTDMIMVKNYTPVTGTSVTRTFILTGITLSSSTGGTDVVHGLGNRNVSVAVYDNNDGNSIGVRVNKKDTSTVNIYTSIAFTADIIVQG